MRAAELRYRAFAPVRSLWALRAEALTSLAIVGGWGALTWGVVGFVPAYAAPIWRVSLGLLLISLAGWKFIATTIATGLYTLTRKP